MHRLRGSGRWLSVFCIALHAAARLAHAEPPSADERETPERPRLVVLIVVDQLRADYLTRFAPLFGKGGFQRAGFAGFTHAYYRFGGTATAPGHATISTGACPSQHGIVGNEWFADGIRVYCVEDEKCPQIGGTSSPKSSGRSPANLIGTTLGDQLKLATGRRAKVWSVSLKDRAAILLGGKLADGAIWWDGACGRFVSSTFSFERLPVWAAKLNEDHFADRFFGTRWERCLPEAVYAQYCRADEAAYERGPTKQLANTFPKIIDGHESEPSPAYYEALACSPLGNELVLELARCTIDAEQLGVDETSDLLGIGLSSNDAVGHLFGPYSHEALDMTVRTDQQLSAFLNWLDARVGLGHCLIVVTADHGVGLEPEYARELRLGGGRVDPRKVMDDVESALVRRFGAPSDGRPFVTGFKAPWLYLNMVVLDEMEIARAEAARIGAAALAGHTGHVPRAGIAGAYPGVPAELAEAATDDPIAACALQSTFPGRSGEIYVHLEPFWGFSSLAAEHSSANSYDRHVPILILGSRIAAGRYSQPADPCDLAVTLAMLLDLAPPVNATGRVLREAITDSAAR